MKEDRMEFFHLKTGAIFQITCFQEQKRVEINNMLR